MIIQKVGREDLDISFTFESPMFAGVLFGGDRFSCIDWGLVAKEDEETVGIATVSLLGEFGCGGGPTIVGLYVKKDWRNKGIGKLLLTSAIDELSRVRVDIVTQEGLRVVNSLPQSYKDKLEIHNCLFLNVP